VNNKQIKTPFSIVNNRIKISAVDAEYDQLRIFNGILNSTQINYIVSNKL